MSQELEILDQLLAEDMPLDILASLFPDLERYQRAVGAMLLEGKVAVIEPSGQPVPHWRYRHLRSDPSAWAPGTGYLLSITDAGAEHIT